MSLIIAFLLLGILVFIHELGHLLAGLAVGIKAEAFSIGFGPAVISKNIKGINFKISAFPFGGYCKFKGESAEGAIVSKDDFMNLSPLKRISVYFAGPMFNYLFAVFIFIILVSMPMTRVLYPPKVAVFEDSKYLNRKTGNTVAYQYGLRSGDTIISVNGRKTESDFDVINAISDNSMDLGVGNINFAVLRNNEEMSIIIPSVELLKGISGEKELGLFFGDNLKIKKVISDSSAEEAELKEGDIVTAINGKEVQSIAEFRPIVMDNPSTKITITVLRDGKTVVREAIPKQVKNKDQIYGSLGVEFESSPLKVEQIAGTPFPQSIKKGFDDSVSYLKSYIAGLKLLFTGKLSLKENIGGPVRIIQLTSQVVANAGFQRIKAILSFMATISLVLFFMNLLPLPVVDGGMILFCIVEIIIRKPIRREIMSRIQMIGAFFLVALAILITTNDITQLFR